MNTEGKKNKEHKCSGIYPIMVISFSLGRLSCENEKTEKKGVVQYQNVTSHLIGFS
jgi:hypothetical protein